MGDLKVATVFGVVGEFNFSVISFLEDPLVGLWQSFQNPQFFFFRTGILSPIKYSYLLFPRDLELLVCPFSLPIKPVAPSWESCCHTESRWEDIDFNAFFPLQHTYGIVEDAWNTPPWLLSLPDPPTNFSFPSLLLLTTHPAIYYLNMANFALDCHTIDMTFQKWRSQVVKFW